MSDGSSGLLYREMDDDREDGELEEGELGDDDEEDNTAAAAAADNNNHNNDADAGELSDDVNEDDVRSRDQFGEQHIVGGPKK